MYVPVIGSCLVGICWAITILLGRYAGATPMMSATLGCIATGMVGVVLLPFQTFGSVSKSVVGLGLTSGGFNGVGLAILMALLGAAQANHWDTSKMVPTAYGLVIVVVAAGAWMWFGELMPAPRLIGIAMILMGIWLVA